jgi:hypothetical protein
LGAFLTTGWLIGACYRIFEKDEAVLLVIPSLIPAAAAQLFLRGNATLLGFVDRLDIDVQLAVGMTITSVAMAIGLMVAMRITREIVQ